MKGIILAGGLGSRLYPLTKVISKQLMPVYDKPMIYYPLSTLMLSGITDILIITTREDNNNFKKLLGDGSELGCSFSYIVQDNPNGLAQSFIIGEKFIGEDDVALILGDNIFYGSGLINTLLKAKDISKGANIFAYKVNNPKNYGVTVFDKNNKVISIFEKPKKFISNYAIPGIYFYPNDVIRIAKTIKPSQRNEYEITDVNKTYLKNNKLNVIKMNRGIAWLDTGTFDSLIGASHFVKVIEDRQGVKIGCIEEVAYRKGYIDKSRLTQIANKFKNNGYGNYLLSVID